MFSLLLANVVCFCALRLAAGSTPGLLPNVIVLFVDDMGIDQIEVPLAQRTYGYTGNNGTISTPNIKALAAQGMVFQNWYESWTPCLPRTVLPQY